MLRLLAFILFPALELYLLVKVGAVIGAFTMVLWVFASAVLGIWAVQVQGRGVMDRVRTELGQGRMPQTAMMDSLMLFFAGVLLILPGLITDALGILLLIPFTRHLFMNGLGRYMARTANHVNRAGQGGGSTRIIFYSSGGGFDRMQPPPPPEETGPRPATIIDSTAVEITSTPGEADNDRDAAGKPSSGASGVKD